MTLPTPRARTKLGTAILAGVIAILAAHQVAASSSHPSIDVARR